MPIRLVKKVRSELEGTLEEMTEHLASGRVTDWEAYKFTVGKIDGLRRALDVVNEANRQYEEDDDA
jgi:hypothetical protein